MYLLILGFLIGIYTVVKDRSTVVKLLAVGVPAVIAVIIALSPSSDKPNQNTPPTADIGTQVAFNLKSSGRDWNAASESEKRSLCQRLATASLKGKSANFFYDVLNATYSSSDDYVLSQPIDDVTRMAEAAGR